MLKKIKEKKPKLFRLMSKIYYGLIYPVISGRIFYIVYFCITKKRKEINLMKHKGLTNMKATNVNAWRLGNEADHAERRYYLAKFDGIKCFVKIGINDLTVINELKIFQKLKSYGDFVHSPHLILGDFNLSERNDKLEPTTMISIEYLEDSHPFAVPCNIIQFENICEQFICILDYYESIGLVHADIHKNNLLISNNMIIVIDYGISKFVGDSECIIDYSVRPGTFFYYENDFRVYDDAFSFVKMMESFSLPSNYYEIASFLDIKGRIGQNVFKVKC